MRTSTSTVKPNIHALYLVGPARRSVLRAAKTSLKQSQALYRKQLMRLSRALKDKRPQYNERHDKVILQHDNVAKSVKTYLETLKWEVLPHPLYFPDIAPSDYHLFRSMAHGLADQR